MRLSPFAALSCLLGLALPAGGAQAAVSFVGPGLAYSCYLAVEYGVDTSSKETTPLDICDAAVSDSTGRELAGSLVNRSIIKIRMGNVQAALADNESAIRVQPMLGEAHANRGVALLQLGRSQDALESLDKGLQYGVSKPYAAYYDRGLVRENLGDVKGAYFDYKQSMDLKPDFLLATEQLKRFTVVTRGGPQ